MERFEEDENSFFIILNSPRTLSKYRLSYLGTDSHSQGNDEQHHTTILKSLLEMVPLWKEFT